MKAYAICIRDNEVSEKGMRILINSSESVYNKFDIERFDATTANLAKVGLIGNGLKWNYPWQGEEIDIATGLIKRAYPTQYPNRRIACAISHYRLWHKCVKSNEPILILEHDAEFIEKLDPEYIINSKYEVIGINNPLMATRRSHQFLEKVKKSEELIQPIPTIDEFNVPQGLAGNSAYIIKPNGAKAVIDVAHQYGLWPNDALMCKQLVKNMGVTKKFYTKVQGLPSTTTG